MDTNIVTLDNKGRFRINDKDALVFNLYRTVYSLPNVDKKLYEERIDKAGLLLTMIRLGGWVVEGEDSAILNLTWGVHKIGRIEKNEFDAFFKKELKRLHNYEGHGRVVEYVNTCLAAINATFTFQITQEKMPASAYKTVEQLDHLSELITENEKKIELMVKATREAAKEMGERLDEAEKKLAEKDGELKKVCEENERMKSKEFRDDVGKEYLLRMFKGYLKNAKKWSQGRRDKEYDWLEHLLKLEGIPQDVKEMIESLAEDKEGEKGGMTVNTQTYVETQNNNYK